MSAVNVIQERALNLARLNDFLCQVQPPARRLRAILALLESDCITERAATLLIEHHGLDRI
jgi:hypothetical protein